jgi:glycosyltransferase involved in cell wall biosynthesis
MKESVGALEDFCRSVTTFGIPSDRSRLAWTAMTVTNLARRRPYDVAWLRNSRFAAHVSDRLERERYDVVHLDTVGLAPYAEGVRGPAVVLNHHNVESHMMARRAEREDSRLRSFYLRVDARKLAGLERRVCPLVHCNLVVSPLDARRLVDIVGPVETAVVDNGVDVTYFRPRTEPGSGRGLVFVGGMSWYPNREAMEYFVGDIWPLVSESHPDLTAEIVGRRPSPAVVEAGRDPRLTVTGWVDDVRDHLDSAAIYVCPILDGGGTRLKILDALAMAKPLVATEMAVEGLDLTEGQHYVRAETPEDYRDQIARLLGDASMRRRLATAGRRLVEERYSWEAIGAKMRRAYEAAVDSAGVGTGRAE